jgi:fatty acid desaturase
MYAAWNDADQESGTGTPPPAAADTPPPAPTQQTPAPQPAHAEAPRDRRERRGGGIVGGSILVVLGLIFLGGQFWPWLDIEKLWPLILIAVGISILARNWRR